MVQYLADIYHAVSSALQGMAITIKHIFRKPVTLQYPDERWVLPERFRGFIHLNTHLCNACMQCAKSCPVSCIYIEVEGKGKDRYMTRWACDFNKCIWCGFCCDPCPTAAVTMSHDYDHSLYNRRNLVYEFVPADKPVPTHKDVRREMGYFVEEKEPAAKKPAAEKSAAEKPAAEKPAAPAEPKAAPEAMPAAKPEPKPEAEPETKPETKPEPAAADPEDKDEGEPSGG